MMADKTTLEQGSYLVMFTDGLSELHMEGGVLLGEEALGGHLSRLIQEQHRAGGAGNAGDIAGKLTALLDSLQEGMAKDDRTFLVARRV